MRILIVEDNSAVLMGLQMMVENIGHEVVDAIGDAEIALRRILETQPDLVLMDINLSSKMSGIDIFHQVKLQADIPFLFITAYSDSDLMRRTSELGAIGYIVKPVTEDQLRAQILLGMDRYAEIKKAQQEASYYKKSLEERKIIERAKGILMDRLNIKEAEAMSKMQKRSRDNNVKLVKVAEDIIKANEYLSL